MTAPETGRARVVVRVLIATALLHLLLIQPNHPMAMAWGALLLFPLELPVIILGLLALGQSRAGYVLRGLITLALTLVFILKTADFISFTALSRGFNPVTDLSLIDAFVRLMLGSLGAVLTVATLVMGTIGILLVAIACWWATGVWAALKPRRPWALIAAPAALLAAVVAVAEVGRVMDDWSLPFEPPGAAFTARLGAERVELVRDTLQELGTFRRAAANDPFERAESLFEAIDRDVLVIFVESYGRTSFDTPLFADLHLETLERYGSDLSARGVSQRSGFLTTPTRGGQSWLSHATFANGLWVNNQVSYAAALSSGRQTLYHHAAAAGLRTATVMPQITLEWPESERMGFEEVLVADDLGYGGVPLNWVTMPDQFTLAALDRLVRSSPDPRHLFAQVVLVSSHAPWVPVPEILAWDAIGDGSVYNALMDTSDPPGVVWRDRDRVRAQYRLAVDYALQSVFEYALLHADDPPLILVIGDHQAAEFIALDDRAEVPFHVIGPAALVDRLSQVAPTPGLIPDDDVPVIAMDSLRDILLTAFSMQSDQRLGN